MALNLAITVKNSALNKAWRESGTANRIWLTIPGAMGAPHPISEEVLFNLPSNGTISLSGTIMFLVSEHTTVDKIWIGTSSANYSNLGRIDLEYNVDPDLNEQVQFGTNGIYVINQLIITLEEED